MTWRHPTAQEMDHRRDLRKHDWRDPPEQRPVPDEQAAYAAAAAYFNQLFFREPQ